MAKRAAVALALLLPAACGGGRQPTGDAASVRAAVEQYSAAYLGDRPEEAFAMLSARCKERVPLAEMRTLTAGAKRLYGTVKLVAFSAEVSGGLARATYRYDNAAINQTAQPWAREDGAWRYDAC